MSKGQKPKQRKKEKKPLFSFFFSIYIIIIYLGSSTERGSTIKLSGWTRLLLTNDFGCSRIRRNCWNLTWAGVVFRRTRRTRVWWWLSSLLLHAVRAAAAAGTGQPSPSRHATGVLARRRARAAPRDRLRRRRRCLGRSDRSSLLIDRVRRRMGTFRRGPVDPTRPSVPLVLCKLMLDGKLVAQPQTQIRAANIKVTANLSVLQSIHQSIRFDW